MDRTGSIEHRADIAEAFERATRLVVQHLADRGDLSLTSAAVLSRLREDGPVRLTALAAAIGVRQPSMTQLVQRLERDGLATRVSDPEDRRGTLVGITDAGRELLDDLRQARRDRLAALLATLSAEDEAALSAAMQVALPILQRLKDTATGRADGGAAAPGAGAGALFSPGGTAR